MDELSKSLKPSSERATTNGWRPLLLASFLVAGQFLACFWATDRLWPFHPLLVYVQAGDFQAYRAPILVAFRGMEEADILQLGWVPEHMERKLAGRVARAETREERERHLAHVAEFLRSRKMDYEGLRAYRLTFDLRKGTVLEKELLAETRWSD